MKSKIQPLAPLLLLLTSILLSAQPDTTPRSFQSGISFRHLKENIYLVRDNTSGKKSSSLALITADGTFLVNGQKTAGNINTELNRLGSSRIRYYLSTDLHEDHLETAAGWANEGAVLIGTPALKKILLSRGSCNDTATVQPHGDWAFQTITERTTIKLGGEKIDIMPLPSGHTTDDVIVFFRKSKALALGDYFTPGAFPHIDLTGGDFVGFFGNAKYILDYYKEDVTIIPGHEASITNDEAYTMVDYREWLLSLVASIRDIKKGIDEGKTLEQLRTTGVINSRKHCVPSLDLSPQKWIEMVYKSRAELEVVLRYFQWD